MSGEFNTPPRGPTLTRERLIGHPHRRLHSGRNRSKATVDLFESATPPFVLKDVASRPWPVRRLFGPWQLRRETRAYRVLEGLRGIPRLLAVVDSQAIAIEYIPGRPLRSVGRGELGAEFFTRLEGLIHAMHERGVAHGDLHHGDILAAPGDQPYVIDFATTCIVPPHPGWARRWIYRQMRDADLRAVAKLRRRLAREGGPEPPARTGLYRLGSALRRLIGRRA